LPARLASRSQPAARGAFVRSSVGRQEEFNQIRAAFHSVSCGKGRMVAIAGDPGIGKTTLVEDFLSEMEAAGSSAWIARGRCSERLAQSDPFVPIFEALEDLTHGDSGLEVSQLMESAAPVWLSQLAPQPKSAGGASLKEASSERLRREFLRFL